MPVSLYSLNESELTEQLATLDEKPYRAKQILDWIWKKRVGTIEEMSNLPATLREKLATQFHLNRLEHTKTQGSEDTTLYVYDTNARKLLPERIDRTKFASVVWLPDGSGFFYSRMPDAGSVPRGQSEYHRLAGISVSYLYVLRHSSSYQHVRQHFDKTRPTVSRLGERRDG